MNPDVRDALVDVWRDIFIELLTEDAEDREDDAGREEGEEETAA